ncbi:MAG: hypothetical protein AAF557_09090 [Pseudomonadota bacterium]
MMQLFFAAALLMAGSAMAQVIYKYEIPDPKRPVSGADTGPTGELVPFTPDPLDATSVVGCRIDEASSIVGTYGMGGPGFLGFRLDQDWLVIAIWGAGEWTLVNGKLVTDIFHDQYDRPIPWISEDNDDLSPLIVGQMISDISVEPRSLRILFSNSALLEIDESPDRRPIMEGSKEPRAFKFDDDLRRAVFLAPTTEIWV